MLAGLDVPEPVGEVKLTVAVHAPGVSWAPGIEIVPHCVVATSAVAGFDAVRVMSAEVIVRVHWPSDVSMFVTNAATWA